MVAKWESMANHIQNHHSDHSELFPTCQHGDLSESDRRKKWLKKGSKACAKVSDIINDKRLQNDVKKLSPHYQTTAIEAFHSTINHFAPKMFSFSYHGMYCRIILAALHYNENSKREQAVTREGIPQYSITFPKYKQGGYTTTERAVQQTFDYVQMLLSIVHDIAACNKLGAAPTLRLTIPAPRPLCAAFQRPDKNCAI